MRSLPRILAAIPLAALLGCGGDKAKVHVFVHPDSVTVTAGATAPFRAEVVGSSDAAVAWSVAQSGGGSIDASGLYHAPASPGDFTVVATSHADASRTGLAAVKVVAMPVLTDFSVDHASITAGGSATLTATFTNGTALVDQGVGSLSSGTGVVVHPAATTTYLVTVSNAAGSTVSRALTVTVVPAAAVSGFAPAAATVTAGQGTTLTAAFANGTGVVDQGIGQVSSGVPVAVRPAATTTYHLVVTDPAGGTAAAQTTVAVVPPPAATGLSAAAATVTAGGSTTLTPSFAAGTAVIDQGVGAVSSGTPVTVSPSATTTYTLTVTNAAGTTASTQATVAVVPAPAATSLTAAKGTLSAGGATTLTPTFSGGTGTLDHGLGAVVSGRPVQVSPSATTTYTLTVTNAAGATATAASTVTVVALPTATGLVAAKSPITAGGSTTLTPTFANGTGVLNPGAVTVSSGTPVSVSPAATTAYTLTVTNAAGDTATAGTTVAVVPAPTAASLVAAQPTLTVGGTTTLTATFSGGTGVVNPGAMPVVSGTPVSVSPAATTPYTLTVTNPAGSTATAGATVTVIPAPKVGSFTTALGTIFLGQAGTALTPVFTDGTAVVDHGIGAVASGASVAVNPAATTTYTLTVTNAVGATDTASVTVNVDATPFSIASFDATPAQVDFGQATTLGWTWDGTPTSLSLDGASVLGSAASQVVHPVRRQVYRLSGNNPLGGDSRVLKVAARGLDLLAGNVDGPGYADGAGSAARFNDVSGLAVDSHGNLFVADHDNHAIRKVTPAGVVSTFAGLGGVGGEVDANGASARFYFPFALAVDAQDNLYVADRYAHTIRKVTPSGDVSTLAGHSGAYGYLDDTGAAAKFAQPQGLAVDSLGNVYVADSNNQVIRAITPAGVVTTIAGTAGVTGATNGDGLSAALFHDPLAIACDAQDNLYVADNGNHLVRKLVPNASKTVWTVSTFAGSGVYGDLDGTGTAASFTQMWGIAVDGAGNVWVPLYYSGTVRRISPAGVVTTPLGAAGFPGLSNGPGFAARFRSLVGIAADRGTGALYLGEWDTHDVRKVDAAMNVSLFAGMPFQELVQDGSRATARFNTPGGMAFGPSGELYVADRGFAVRTVAADGTVGTLAGTLRSYGNVNGVGADARFGALWGLARAADGTLYVSDAYYHTVRKVAPDGTVTTLAGSGSAGFANAQGTAAQFNTPHQVALDASGNVYVADQYNHVIRRIAADGTVSTFAGLPNQAGYVDGAGSGPSAVAQFSYPAGLAFDGQGNLIVGDSGNNAIRKVAPDGTVSTLVGPTFNWQSGFVDGDAHTTRFSSPVGVAVDAQGNVFVADYYNHALRKVAPDGSTTTVTGQPSLYGAKPGALPTAPLYHPLAVSMTPDGDVLVTTVNGIMQVTAP